MGETVAREGPLEALVVAPGLSLAQLEARQREAAQAEREAQSLVSELGQRVSEAEYAFDRVVAELRFVQGTEVAQVKQDLARELQGTLHLLKKQKDEASAAFMGAKERAILARAEHQRALDAAARLQQEIRLQESLVMRHETAVRDAERAFEAAYEALESAKGKLEGLKSKLDDLQGPQVS